MRCTRATGNSQPSRNWSTRKRCSPCDDDVVRAVRPGDVAQHVGGRADPVQVVRAAARRSPGLRWSSTPIGRCRRAASCAAARERSRPTVIGSTTPGNSTTLRTGRMMSASSGSGRDLALVLRARGLRLLRRLMRLGISLDRTLLFSISVFMLAFHFNAACAKSRSDSRPATSASPARAGTGGSGMRRSK